MRSRFRWNHGHVTIPSIFIAVSLFMFHGVPLFDRTESRVGVIAQRLVDSHRLLPLEVPKDGVFVSYFAKPPLHYWVVASWIKAFGKSEMAVRLPSLCAAAITLFLVPLCISAHATAAQLILATSLLFSSELL